MLSIVTPLLALSSEVARANMVERLPDCSAALTSAITSPSVRENCTSGCDAFNTAFQFKPPEPFLMRSPPMVNSMPSR